MLDAAACASGTRSGRAYIGSIGPSKLSSLVRGRIARARYDLGTYRHTVAESRKLRRALRRADSLDAAVEAVFTARGEHVDVCPVQVRSEIVGFLRQVRVAEPRRVLEIGIGNGGTLYLLARAAPPGALLLSLDNRPYERARVRLFESFAREGQRVVIRHGDSHSEETRDSVAMLFGGEPLDLLFIDGDHSYEGVRRDWELYEPLVRPGGLIAFHDIVAGPEHAVGGVPRFWREAKASLVEPVELVESWDQGGYGIGFGCRGAGDR
jgi:predicted O-methyltransferase YrrM